MTVSTLDDGTKVPCEKFHDVIANPRVKTVEGIATYYKLNWTGEHEPCEKCAISNAHFIFMNKSTYRENIIYDELMYLDICNGKHA